MELKNQAKRAFATLFMSLLCLFAFAQSRSISGTVIDDLGEPVIGANVIEEGTTNGAITDFDGNFKLTVASSKSKIKVTYIGYAPQVLTVGDQKVFNIQLANNAQDLEEVVVVGYGAVKKKDLTGSVATIGSKSLEAVPVASAAEALTGKMAGVQITTTEGSPDAEMKIRVRGGGSITGDNTPLFIVDGFPVESISDIPASEIEDMTVLKDASSTAIYGSRGANGVILVTTKSGKEGKFSVSYNAYYSWKKIAKTLDVLNPYDYAKWQYELAMLHGNADNYEQFFGAYQDMDLYKNIESNDWQDLTFGRTGNTFNHNLNINGGSDKIRYAFGYSHMDDKAIMELSNYKRDNLSLKVNSNPTKHTTADFSVRYAKTTINGGGANDATGAYDSDKRLKYSVIYTPIPLANLDSDAGSADDDLGNLYNPLEAISDNNRQQKRQNINMSGSFGWEIIKNLKFKTEVGYDIYSNEDKKFMGLTTYYVKNVPSSENQNKPAIAITNTTRNKIRNTNTLAYDFKKLFPNENNHLDVMVGHEYVKQNSKALLNEVHGFPESFTADKAWKLTSMGTPYTIKDYYNPDDMLLSFFGRLNYNFKGNYLLSATFRADASSKFSDDNRWGYFPSVALAWRVSSEPFMEKTKDWLDDLKLRVSYGTAGNNNIPSGQLVQNYTNSATTWINGFDNVWNPSKVMANPDLKWETTITRNIGLDYTTLGGRLSGSFEVYLNNTKDLLIQFPVGGTGYDTQYRNMGKTENKGFEASVNYTIVDKKNWGLSVNANIGFNKNKVKSLGLMDDFGANTGWASTEIGNDFWIAKGQAVGQIYGYRSAGRYEVSDFAGYDDVAKKWILKSFDKDDEGNLIPGTGTVTNSLVEMRPGSMKLEDINNDGKIDDNDIVKIGDTNPLHTGGFSINARAYGFDLAANFNWSVGNDVYNANKIEYTSTGKYYYRNMITIMADGKRWTNLNADGTICNDPETLAALNANTTMWSPYTSRMILTDWAVEDASFLRLNTLTLGYTLPKDILKKAHIGSLRFYVTAYNVFCITSYSGFDPEVSSVRKTNLTPGVDYSAYPKSRQFVVGLNLNF